MTSKHISFNCSKTLFLLASFCLISMQGFGDTLVSTVDGYIRSYNAGTNYESEHRTLVGYHENTNLGNLRGVVQYDLSAYSGMTVDAVSLSLTAVAGLATDQNGGSYADIYLKNLGEPFTNSVTWNSFTTNGGDVSGATLSTITGYDVYDSNDLVGGDTFTFASTSTFITEAQSAIDGTGTLSLVFYAPDYEGQGVLDNASTRNFYRFLEHSTLDITVIPEPSALVLLGLGLGTLMLFRRKRG